MGQMVMFSLMFYFLSFLFMPLSLYFSLGGIELMIDWELMVLGGVPINVTLVVDFMSVMFSFVVFFISGNVYWFGAGYMAGEMYMKRFSWLVFFFVVSMSILIFSGNLLTVLLGWDGLGFTSFLLVIYYQNSYSLGAGLMTVFTNRLGDVGLILSIGLLMSSGHWNISVIEGGTFCICCLVMLGALTKSAQYPFSSWLPLAMAAPTPVSALVHSSTLVTAGVYLLIRFFPVMMVYSKAMFLMALVSSMTMVLAGMAAFFEMDFKKVIAYSTLSQLGVMMLAIGLGSPILAFFHLLSHAMFKALMFVCAGTYIYYHGHAQDLRIMGNMTDCLPITQLGFIMSNLALCGFPFLSGFYSKDPVYELTVNDMSNFIVGIFMAFGLLMTAMYSIRSLSFSQLGPKNQFSFNCFSNNLLYFVLPVIFLSFLAVVWGSALNWLLPPLFLGAVSLVLGVLPLFLLVLSASIFCFLLFNSTKARLSLNWGSLEFSKLSFVEGFSTLWFVSFISSQYLVKDVVKYGASFIYVVDRGWVEMSTGQGSLSASSSVASWASSINTGVTPLILLAGVVSSVLLLML